MSEDIDKYLSEIKMAHKNINILCANSKIEPRRAKTSPDSRPNGAPSPRALEGV